MLFIKAYLYIFPQSFRVVVILTCVYFPFYLAIFIPWTNQICSLQSSSMSKRRSSERGAGETSGRASKLQCPGISGSNAKRAGPFILGMEATTV